MFPLRQEKKDFSYRRQLQVSPAGEAASQPVHVELAYLVQMLLGVHASYELIPGCGQTRGARSRASVTFLGVFRIPVPPVVHISVEVVREVQFLPGQGTGKAGKAALDRFREQNGLLANGALGHASMNYTFLPKSLEVIGT